MLLVSRDVTDHRSAELPPVLGDATQTEQVVSNPIRNSVEAVDGRPEPLIAIAAVIDDNR